MAAASAQRYSIHTGASNQDAAQDAHIVVLAVKPQVADRVMSELRGSIASSTMVISIMAGIKVRDIVEETQNTHVVRAMPNMPAQIGQGITAWTSTYEVLDEQRDQARMLLGALGKEIYFDDEKYLDMATALSGSGPAFVYLFLESMIDAGVRMGFSRSQAERIATQTMLGSLQVADQSGQHPALLRNQVTSPGGTTAAGLLEMERWQVRMAVDQAVNAAYHRSIELGEADS